MRFSKIFLYLTVGAPFALPSAVAHAESCPSGDSHSLYLFAGFPRPVDAHPWAGLDSDEAREFLATDPSCVIARVDTDEEIPVSAEVAPLSNESFPAGGCGTGLAFRETLVRFAPEDLLEPNTTYRIRCEGEFFFEEGQLSTGDQMAEPPPEIVVERLGTEEWCDSKRVMRLHVSGPDSRFWDDGGIILAEYENGAVDWIGWGADEVFLELPEEGDEVLVLTVINGAGVAGTPLELDVTAIAGPRELEGCAAGGRPRALSGLVMLGLLLGLRGRRRPFAIAKKS